MAVNEKLTERVRELLAAVPNVTEKRMFRGVTFMVDGKICVSVGDDRLLCRIDPELHAEAARMPGCRTMEMGGRSYAGFVYVDEKQLGTKRALKAWIDLALEFNPRAAAARKPKAKPAGGRAKGKSGKAAKGKARKSDQEGSR